MAASGRKSADAVLVATLAGGATVADAALAAGVAERTVYRRLQDPAFVQAVNGARAEMITRAVGQLADASTEAAATLRNLLSATSETVQLGAARSVLEMTTRLRESEELERRITEIEAKLAASDQKGIGR